MPEDFEDKLDSPFVVHKETDASYEKNDNELDVNITHIEGSGATLERHRFKKTKKKSKAPYFICALIVVAAVVAGLYYGGIIPNFFEKETTVPEESENNVSTTEANKFEGVITVKGTYLFFEGKEINGTEELINEIKYIGTDKKFIVQDENADSNYLNNEILPVLTSYNIQYEVKYIISSGLVSSKETTAAASSAEASSGVVSSAN